jgi:protein-S-isoprenylcysteine O-methyltransferase Ste14
MSALETKVPPPIVMLLFAGVMWLAAAAISIQLSGIVRTATMFILAAAGLIVELAGVVSFARARTTVDPIHPRTASKLVVNGIYRFTRNPIYLGDFLLLLAWAVFLSSPLALAIAPLFLLYINRFQIGAEERALLDLFGEQYSEYKARVHRWL